MPAPRRVIGVLELGLPPPGLANRYPGYAQMIIDWLQPALPDVEYRVVATVRGAALPAVEEFDGLVYSGSRHGVYDEVPWIAPLLQRVRELTAAGTPQFGICFGHQLLAQALGGAARKAAAGWSCGVQAYQLSEPIENSGRLQVLVMHQDQVFDLPAGARVLGSSPTCPIGIIEHAPAVRSVQFHPEFSADFVARLLEAYGGSVIPAPIAEQAAATLTADLDYARVARWTAGFFRRHFADAGSA